MPKYGGIFASVPEDPVVETVTVPILGVILVITLAEDPSIELSTNVEVVATPLTTVEDKL